MCLRTNEPQKNSEDLTGKGRQGYIECLGSIWGDYGNTETTIVAALTTSVVTESAKILEIGNGVLMLHSLVGESVT